jgi:hypothetical protein
VAPNGDIFVVGTLGGTLDVGGTQVTAQGSTDIFLVKSDAAGNLGWRKSFGSSGVDTATGVTADSEGNVIVTGTFSGTFSLDEFFIDGANDGFVAKFSGKDGTLLYLEPSPVMERKFPLPRWASASMSS